MTRSVTDRTPAEGVPSKRRFDGALLRLAIDGHDWAEHVPPVPPGARVSAAFSTHDALAAHGDALALLGYRIVGVIDPGDGDDMPEFVDLLVAQDVLETHGTWWRAVAGLATHAFNLAHGPVLAALAAALRPHADERGGGPAS